MNAVTISKVCKSFGSVRAVDELSVQVPAGSIYGFLGPNGAGKTTTIRMIMNILRPDSGSVEVFGNGSGDKRRPAIGYMPEERGLYRKMKVQKALAYFGAIKGLRGPGLSGQVTNWLGRVGLADWADKKVEELSRGMHQKLQFAVTAIDEPELLILDEPFSGLDPVNLDLIKAIILEMRNEGKTVLFSTHVMDEAQRLCDRIVLINTGRVVLEGSVEQIRRDHTADVVSVQLGGDTGFVAGLSMVDDVIVKDNRLEISLADGCDSQDLLQALIGKTPVLAFEVKTPSLHEIFIKEVGAGNA